MGFARIHFVNTGTLDMRVVVRDIASVIAGDSLNTLVAATQNLSYIYNSAGRGNWTRQFPATASTSMPQVLSAACLNGQSKFIQIGAAGVSDTIGNSTSTDFYGTGLTANNQFIYIRSCTAATSATSISNPSFVAAATTTPTNANQFNAFNGVYYYLSWSLRHCLIIGQNDNATGNKWWASGCFEMNEDGIDDFRNLAPFCHIHWHGSSVDTAVAPVFVASEARSTFTVMNHYNVSTGVTTSARNIANEDYGNILQGSASAVSTKNSSGAVAMYLQPLFYHQYDIGVPLRYISDLSKVYRARSSPGEHGNTLTVGADTYVYVPLANHSMGLACLRN